MASSVKNNGIEGAKELAEQSGKTLKDGESLVGPTRRPDGTLRKPIKIRAGYVPQQEIAIHQSKGTLEIDRKDPSLDLSSLDSAIYEISNLNILATAAVDIYKKIRAIKKKIRLAEAKLQNISTENMKLEQLEKLKKLENWREELKLLEGANTTPPSTSSL